MDWTTLFPMFGALLGSAVTGAAMYLAQRAAQKNENLRNARKLAVDLAIAEWTRQTELIENDKLAGSGKAFPPIDGHFLSYLLLVEALLGNDPVSGEEAENIACNIRHAERIAEAIRKKSAPEVVHIRA